MGEQTSPNELFMKNLLTGSLNRLLCRITGEKCSISRLTEAGGGSISHALVAETDKGKYFVKRNSIQFLAMFEAEADGLQALSACPSLRVPHVIGCESDELHAYLILEYINMYPLPEGNISAVAGQTLAELHGITNNNFGWHQSNFIGSTPQSNIIHENWSEFFAHERLLPQLALAKNRRADRLVASGERLAENLHVFFTSYRPAAVLLHGDLWRGNAAIDKHGKLVLFDPAVYFGDRETDLAMTRLFGGFPSDFYAAYTETQPLSAGYSQRQTLYNLYHVLNHFNLFGGAYQHEAEHMIRRLLAEIG